MCKTLIRSFKTFTRNRYATYGIDLSPFHNCLFALWGIIVDQCPVAKNPVASVNLWESRDPYYRYISITKVISNPPRRNFGNQEKMTTFDKPANDRNIFFGHAPPRTTLMVIIFGGFSSSQEFFIPLIYLGFLKGDLILCKTWSYKVSCRLLHLSTTGFRYRICIRKRTNIRSVLFKMEKLISTSGRIGSSGRKFYLPFSYVFNSFKRNSNFYFYGWLLKSFYIW